MAFYDSNLSRFSTLRIPAVRPLAALRGFLDTPFDARARRIRARIAELKALSDAELAAMGVARSDITRHALLSVRD